MLPRWFLCLLIALSVPACASPGAPADPVTELLQTRGWVSGPQTSPAEGQPGLLSKVRDRASEMVMTAMNFLGVPYRRGGDSAEEGFDCSGFTRHIFEMSLGLVLPRRVDEQAHAPGLFSVKRDELQPGDLVFFNTLRRTFSHVGIYVGDGKFIHSPRTGAEVRIEDMRMAYWTKRYTGARRPATLAESPASTEAAAVASPAIDLHQP
ncbi:C40 family peptidase [Schlegelella sp. S2-27]|uniref:C40 family peptidase n=2 Tax=Caldimonas mangrovi TaxID=2944811 RepID=A0ABT0YQG6_9BURK|nr:C40 family peptidase [Caldimonas mangrovi]